jgi:hypothetical protein
VVPDTVDGRAGDGVPGAGGLEDEENVKME